MTVHARKWSGLLKLEKAVNDAAQKLLNENARSENPDEALNQNTEKLAKAVTSDLLQDVIKQDLELYAHNTLWNASSPAEFTLMKLLPSTQALRVTHEYVRITSYGEDRGYGFFGEQTLPRETSPAFDTRVTNIRLIGETSSTYLLASLQKTINVAGETSAEGIAKKMLVLSILRKKARAIYFSDTSTHRQGESGPRFKGVIQLIREGTDGTTDSSRFGSHVIDMEGQPLNVVTLRKKSADIMTLFGYITCLIMSQYTRADFEATLDPALRLQMPVGAQPLMFGQAIGGLRTQGSDITFHTDNMLSPYGQGQYMGTAEVGAPNAAPAVSVTVGAVGGGRTSKWLAADAGEYFWIVTEVRDDRESIGRRYPTTAGTYSTVSTGDEAVFSITPNDAQSDSFRVYRGRTGQDDTDALFCFEVANDGGGAAVEAYDTNAYRAGTSIAMGLAIRSDAAAAMAVTQSGQLPSYSSVRERSDKFLTQSDNADNTVCLAELGPRMGVMELAPVLATTARPLVYTACAPQVRNAFHNVVFINIGDESFTPAGA